MQPRTLTSTDLPFFDAAHRELEGKLRDWLRTYGHLPHPDAAGVDAACRQRVKFLAEGGILGYAVPGLYGGAQTQLDSRCLCLIRESLAFADGLTDFAFAMQALGSGAITVAGSDELKQRYLPAVVRGEAVAAFALSELDAGSDVAAMTTFARLDGDHFVIDGEKTWISNGGIADFYCVFARTEPGAVRSDGAVGAKGISAFVVPADSTGLEIAERIEVIAPHPLARLKFTECRISRSQLIGAPGDGFKIAMRTLDIFRSSVAAAALGFARRALQEAQAHAVARRMFGRTLVEFQLTQAALAEMLTSIESASLLTYRAAWLRDLGKPVTQAAAMAKWQATENAQWVIDRALQMHGALGVKHGEILERLYREIRALRIYEGASEVQQMIIAREMLQ